MCVGGGGGHASLSGWPIIKSSAQRSPHKRTGFEAIQALASMTPHFLKSCICLIDRCYSSLGQITHFAPSATFFCYYTQTVLEHILKL